MNGTDLAWVAPTNTDQLKAWDTAKGVVWADNADLFEHSLQRYDDWLLRAAVIRDGDRVLDVGCGTGSTTRAAAWLAGSGTALGVDLSAPMITAAAVRARETGAGNASYTQADAQIHAFEPEGYDVLLSRTGCTYFGDPVAAFTNLASALRPGASVALLAWQAPSRNPWFTDPITALAGGWTAPEGPSPFAFADPARVAEILTLAGFAMPECEPINELMDWGPDAVTAERLIVGTLGQHFDDDALTELRSTLVAHSSSEGVTFPSAAWLITTHKPA